MHANSEDRIVPARRSNKAPLVIVALLLVAGGIAYQYWQKNPAPLLPVTALQVPSAQPAQPAQPTPRSPAVETLPMAASSLTPVDQVKASEPPLSPAVEESPLPLLDQSDADIKTMIENLANSELRNELSALWLGDNLLRRFVAFVANLAEGKLDSKSSPLAPPKSRFAVTASQPLIMTTESQGRFNTHIQIITSISPSACATTYRRFYPLLHSAYADLGEKKTFHSVMLMAIDRVLATPELMSEPELVPAEKGLYKYLDPALESLPAAQKPLLRMGRKNAAQLKHWLQQVKASILSTQAPAETAQ